MIRFLVFSDLHLNVWNYGATYENGQNSRLMDQLDVLHQIRDYAVLHDIKYIFFTGDFFHTHQTVRAEVLMAAHEALSSLAQQSQLIMLAGNHDMADKEGNVHSLSFLKAYAAVVARNSGLFVLEGHRIQCLPYTEDEDKLKKFLDNTHPGDIVLMHQGVSGIPVSSRGFTLNEILAPNMVPAHVEVAFAGHYHSHRKVKDNLYIPGSPMQLTWSDVGEPRGWLDVTSQSMQQGTSVNFVQSKAPEFVEITMSHIGENIANTNYIPQRVGGNFIRVVDDVPEPIDIQSIREGLLDAGARSVEVIPKEMESVKVARQDFSTITELFKEYTEANGIEGRTLEVGRSLMKGNYAPIIAESS